jgi:hypothetical protein
LVHNFKIARAHTNSQQRISALKKKKEKEKRDKQSSKQKKLVNGEAEEVAQQVCTHEKEVAS